MPLITCSDCNNEMSASAPACPKCGKPNSVVTSPDSDEQNRSVGVLLGIGILFIPIIFSWFTLRTGYSSLTKLISFGWLVLTLVLFGVQDGTNNSMATNPNTAAETKTKPTKSAEELVVIVNDCVNVPSDMVDAIADGLSVGGGGTLVKSSARAIKSTDFKKLYFIAAEIQGQSIEGNGEIGLWGSNSLEPGRGMLFSVNYMAIEFSVWPNATKLRAPISQNDHGGQEAISCVERAQDA